MKARRFGHAACYGAEREKSRCQAFPPLIVIGAFATMAMPAQTAIAQEKMAGVETENLYLETIPQTLPGHQKGARQSTDEGEVTTLQPAEGDSWWQWETATGDWNGFRTDLREQGIDFQGSYTIDWSSVWHGGLSTEGSTQRLLDFNFNFDLEKIFDLQGATFFLDYYSTSGTGTAGHVGDFQGVSNIETDRDLDILAEVWYEQWFLDDSLRFKVGKVDANSEFGFVEVACEFIGSTCGVSPTIFTLPTYPDPATGINLFLYPDENWYVGFGFYDGAATVDGVPTGTRGPKSFFNDDLSDDYFLIGETGCNYGNLCDLGPGRFAFGVWHHTGEFATFAGGTDDGTEGFYALIEQQLWLADADDPDGTKLSIFGQYGFADDEVSEVGHHFGGGLVLNAPFASRPDDALGGMVSFVDLSDEVGASFPDDETAFELFYKLQLTPFAVLKPDLQFITHPGGDPTIDDAVVGTFRFEVMF